MKKWYVLGGVVAIIIIINGIFWYWLSIEQVETYNVIEVENDSEFSDNFIEFRIEKENLLTEKTKDGQFWFNGGNDGVVISYNRIWRSDDLTLIEQFNTNVLEDRVCPISSDKKLFQVYYDCQYLSGNYTFIVLERDQRMIVVGLNQLYLNDKEIDNFINNFYLRY